MLTAQIKEIESQDSAENADEIRKWNDIEEMHSKVWFVLVVAVVMHVVQYAI